MAYTYPFTVTAYDAAGKFKTEEDFKTSFEADTTAQRLSADGRTALVKDRRHSVSKLIRVWINGHTVFCTVHEGKVAHAGG
jgi:hypothetical protein